MDRKVFLALILSAAVVVVFQLLFPPPKPVTRPRAANDTTAIASSATASGTATAVPAAGTIGTPGAPSLDSMARVATGRPAVVGSAAETTLVETAKVRYRVSSLGARPVGAELREYTAVGADGRRTTRPVELLRAGDAVVGYRLVVPGDTIDLAQVAFTRTRGPAAPAAAGAAVEAGAAAEPLEYRATLPNGIVVTIAYTFAADNYTVNVAGRVENAPSPAFVLAELPHALASSEADTLEDSRHFAIAYKPEVKDAVGLPFGKISVDKPIVGPGPLSWVVAKSKYFIVGFLTPPKDAPFREVQVRSARTANVSRFFGTSTVTTAASAAAVEALPADGSFRFEIYAGPQEFERLQAMGRNFEDSNPYGGWLQGIIQPFATVVMKVLLWMKRNLSMSYGWILVLFGVVVRLAMWPFQQRAMRSSMTMQRIQPQLQQVQERYRNDPQRLQQEMFKVYKEHGVSPFSAFSGCLPMLIPMPVFFALFFVFQNTIEFRGVPFLWLNDISLYDPLFILPVIMGLSSWVLAWVGMRNAPPNPQAKMMSYMFPAMMTVFLWKFASGLNLYYTVQNIAALPQQWLLANERGKAAKK
jgi:YidC/Oxa1 family membrane protein insertase